MAIRNPVAKRRSKSKKETDSHVASPCTPCREYRSPCTPVCANGAAAEIPSAFFCHRQRRSEILAMTKKKLCSKEQSFILGQFAAVKDIFAVWEHFKAQVSRQALIKAEAHIP